MSRCLRMFRVFPVVALLSLIASVAWAQETVSGLPQAGEMAGQSLRPYWHVFIAYALAVLLLMGWVVSLSRRLRAVEESLSD